MKHKSTPEEIRSRFDADVERFSNLETGQVAAIDSPLHMELLTEAAVETTPHARHALDIGCGAGNYTLKLLERLPGLEVTLIDLSRPMLDRAAERVAAVTEKPAHTVQGDIREVDLGERRYDIVMAAQCLHHLREEADWDDVFTRVFESLRPGGSFWIADSLEHGHPGIEHAMRRRWGDYLTGLKGEAYRDHVLAYVEKEDTPRSLTYQMDLLRRVGFEQIEVLHKHNRFASFGGIKPGASER